MGPREELDGELGEGVNPEKRQSQAWALLPLCEGRWPDSWYPGSLGSKQDSFLGRSCTSQKKACLGGGAAPDLGWPAGGLHHPCLEHGRGFAWHCLLMAVPLPLPTWLCLDTLSQVLGTPSLLGLAAHLSG